MDKNELQQFIHNEIKRYLGDKQFSVSKIQNHTHNGVDTVQINQKDIIQGNKITCFLIEQTTETFTITNIPNIHRLTLSGFAANNVAGPATKRAIVNGVCEFGNGYQFTGTGTSISFSSNTPLTPSPIQTSNFMYVDSTDLTKNRVGASNGTYTNGSYQGHLCIVNDDTGTIVAQLDILNYTNNTITFQATMAVGWKLQAALTLT